MKKIKLVLTLILFYIILYLNNIAFAISEPIYLTTYAENEIINAEKKIEEISNENTTTFSFITDLHADVGTISPMVNVEAFRKIGTNPKIDFGICAGDMTTGQYEDLYSGKSLHNLQYYSNILSDTDMPVLFARGNHDCNSRQDEKVAISGNQYYKTVLKQLSDNAVFNQNDLGGNYYYKDLENKKIRVCVLNAFNGGNYEFIFGEEQLNFIENKVLNFSQKENPEEWQVLFLSHTVDETVAHDETPSDNERLYKIINNFQEKENGTVIAIITGHHHLDSTIIKNNILIITVCSANLNLDRQTVDKTEKLSKDDICFDLFTIDKKTKTLYSTRVGRGNDRKWSYDINNLKEQTNEDRKRVEINDNKSEINIKTYVTNNNEAIAIVTSNLELKPKTNKTWILSEDKKTYIKILNDVGEAYETSFSDIKGFTKSYVFNPNVIKDVRPPELKLEYVENEDGTITAIVTSHEILKTKGNKDWKISEDRLTYTYTFTKNTENYITPFNDVFNNMTTLTLNVNVFNPSIEYSVNKENGVVTAVAKSKIKFAKTKSSVWKLSDDGFTYTTTYTDNQNYDTLFTDIYGNEVKKRIFIDEYGKIANVNINYKKNEDGTITAIATSDLKFANTKPSWTLSEDGYTYTKIFYSNQDYKTPFTNIFHGKSDVKIIINDFEEFSINMKYEKNNDGTVTAKAISNRKFAEIKPSWTLSEDGYAYTKIFYSNQDYSTPFTDIFGNVIKINIKIKT